MPAQEHILWFMIDEPRQIPEMNEANNLTGLAIPARPAMSAEPSGVSWPGPKQTGAQARPTASTR